MLPLMMGMGGMPTSAVSGASGVANQGINYGSLLSGAGSLLGTALGGYGQYEAGQQEGEATEHNANLLRQRADVTVQARDTETTRMGKGARRLKATQEAIYSKSGAQAGAGTPLMVMAEQAGEMQRDILETRRTRMVEEQQLRSRADYMSEQAQRAKRKGKYGGLGSIIGGGLGLALGGPAGAALGSGIGSGLGGAIGGR